MGIAVRESNSVVMAKSHPLTRGLISQMSDQTSEDDERFPHEQAFYCAAYKSFDQGRAELDRQCAIS
jgi:hypothetical protein